MKRKELIVLGGPNGSGKTTFAKTFLKERKGEYYFLNADEIAKSLEHDKRASGSVAAGKVYFDRLARLKDKSQSVIIESTLSGKFLHRWISELKSDEFEIIVIYVFLNSPELCIHRIQNRVLLGGHYVSDEDVVRRYYRGAVNFWHIYRQLADRWFIYNNSQEEFDLVAVGQKEEFTVANTELFKQFGEIIEEQ